MFANCPIFAVFMTLKTTYLHRLCMSVCGKTIFTETLVINRHTVSPGKIRVILLIKYAEGVELIRLPVTRFPLIKKNTITAIWPEYVVP
jgi:hypothetical protein